MSPKDPGSGNTAAGTPNFNPHFPVRIVVAESPVLGSTSQVFRVYSGRQTETDESGMCFVTSTCLSQSDVFLEFRTQSGQRTFEAATVIENESIDDGYLCRVVFVRNQSIVDRDYID
jgi:hypothetical protein